MSQIIILQFVLRLVTANTCWFPALTLGGDNNAYGTTKINGDDAAFTTNFYSSKYRIIRRQCESCRTQKDVYYRRNKQDKNLDPTAAMSRWYAYDEKLGTDFKIYSTFEDAIYETNEWKYCGKDQSKDDEDASDEDDEEASGEDDEEASGEDDEDASDKDDEDDEEASDEDDEEASDEGDEDASDEAAVQKGAFGECGPMAQGDEWTSSNDIYTTRPETLFSAFTYDGLCPKYVCNCTDECQDTAVHKLSVQGTADDCGRHSIYNLVGADPQMLMRRLRSPLQCLWHDKYGNAAATWPRGHKEIFRTIGVKQEEVYWSGGLGGPNIDVLKNKIDEISRDDLRFIGFNVLYRSGFIGRHWIALKYDHSGNKYIWINSWKHVPMYCFKPAELIQLFETLTIGTDAGDFKHFIDQNKIIGLTGVYAERINNDISYLIRKSTLNRETSTHRMVYETETTPVQPSSVDMFPPIVTEQPWPAARDRPQVPHAPQTGNLPKLPRTG